MATPKKNSSNRPAAGAGNSRNKVRKALAECS
jgi:hypothetical protein